MTGPHPWAAARAGGHRGRAVVAFIIGLLLFIVLAGLVDSGLPWPRSGAAR